MSTKSMPKRVFLTLPDTLHEDLSNWAEAQGRPVANLAAFLVEIAVREAKMNGEIPDKKENKVNKK